MTPADFQALISNPAREHDPLLVVLDGAEHMVVGFDGENALLFGGGKVAIAGLRKRGGRLVQA